MVPYRNECKCTEKHMEELKLHKDVEFETVFVQQLSLERVESVVVAAQLKRFGHNATWGELLLSARPSYR